MVVSPYRVGFLEGSGRSDEGRAAYAWCSTVFDAVERVPLSSLRSGPVALDDFDAL
jgi:hypothetical protein